MKKKIIIRSILRVVLCVLLFVEFGVLLTAFGTFNSKVVILAIISNFCALWLSWEDTHYTDDQWMLLKQIEDAKNEGRNHC